MIILHSLLSLFMMLTLFSVLGLGVTNAKMAKNNLALVPVFGFAALIGLSYVISANLKIAGGTAVGWTILLLFCSFIFRIKSFLKIIPELKQNGELYFLLAVILIPIFTLIFPAIIMGFKYFYAYVNYDFFYNSQDSWFLQTHNVIQYNENNTSIIPLNWSANSAGRIAVALIGAFFSPLLSETPLEFNSLLLNAIVILFALVMSVFCKEFFNLNKRAILLAVFFSLLSAGYVQGYSYYVLGQISVIPIFVLFCIFLKRFLDDVANSSRPREIMNINLLAMALLLNVLFFLYAIISFFAGVLTVLSFLICICRSNKYSFAPLFKALFVAIILFCLVRLFIIPESITILKSWVNLSGKVAGGRHGDTFIVFSEYLTEAFLSLFFGLTNYLSTHSVFRFVAPNEIWRINLLVGFGIGAFFVTLLALWSYAKSSENTKSAHAILIALFGSAITLATCFFLTSSGYGIFKLQSWFIPVLLPVYVYCLYKTNIKKTRLLLQTGCGIILALNLFAGVIYINDFFAADTKQRFVNVHGITGNKDIDDIASKLKSYGISPVSLFLTNGMETAWLSNLIRNMDLDKVTHNAQVLHEKEFNESSPTIQSKAMPLSGLMVVSNPNLPLSDVGASFEGGKILYKNKSYMIVDVSGLKSLIYIGSGAYPVEYFPSKDNSFPSKFRWVEKAVEIIIYSNKNKTANLVIEVTPGFVDNKNLARNIYIKTETDERKFSVTSKTTLTLPNLKLHQGLNRLVIESPDAVSRLARYGAFMRSRIPLDPRLNNFAVSYVGFSG